MSPSRVGASTAGPSTTTGARTRECRQSIARSFGIPRSGAGLGAGRRQHRRQRRGEAADHRRVPALRSAGAQPGPFARAIWSGPSRPIWASARSSGWAAASRATTRTATSTTWRASLRSTPWSTVVEPDKSDPNHEPLQENLGAAARARRSEGGHAAHAGAGLFRRPASSGQLREFLHRQRHRAGADVRRQERSGRRCVRWRGCSRIGRLSGFRAAIWCWGWARCTA